MQVACFCLPEDLKLAHGAQWNPAISFAIHTSALDLGGGDFLCASEATTTFDSYWSSFLFVPLFLRVFCE